MCSLIVFLKYSQVTVCACYHMKICKGVRYEQNELLAIVNGLTHTLMGIGKSKEGLLEQIKHSVLKLCAVNTCNDSAKHLNVLIFLFAFFDFSPQTDQ